MTPLEEISIPLAQVLLKLESPDLLEFLAKLKKSQAMTQPLPSPVGVLFTRAPLDSGAVQDKFALVEELAQSGGNRDYVPTAEDLDGRGRSAMVCLSDLLSLAIISAGRL